MPEYLTDDIEISSDDSDERNSDEENFNEENFREECIKLLYLMCQIIHPFIFRKKSHYL